MENSLSKQEVCLSLMSALPSSLVAQCLQSLCSDPNASLHVSRRTKMPLDQAKSIFEARARVQETSPGHIEGFSELIQGLGHLNDINIHICAFTDKAGHEYRIFIGSESLTFAGVLKFPLRVNSEDNSLDSAL